LETWRVALRNCRKYTSEEVMKEKANLIRARLKTPRAAAIAGILFSVLLITGLLLVRLSVGADPLETGTWLKTSSNKVALALNLVPFAGIAFLWFPSQAVVTSPRRTNS
jgi:fumarate reductase subunit C